MKTGLRFIITLLLCAGLVGCGGGEPGGSPLTPMPIASDDPTDAVARAAVTAFLKQTGAPVSSIYQLERADLNNDGLREALVLFSNPYGYWCDTHGCTMLVLRAGHDGFTLLNSIQPVREPVYVSPVRNHGWKDLVIRVSGRWNKTKDVALAFDGRQYPQNPSALPPSMYSAPGLRIFHEY